MKHKKIIIALGIILIIVVVCITIFSIKQSAMEQTDIEFEWQDKTAKQENRNKKAQTLSGNSEVKSALTENVELHATYYLSEVYVEKKTVCRKRNEYFKIYQWNIFNSTL